MKKQFFVCLCGFFIFVGLQGFKWVDVKGRGGIEYSYYDASGIANRYPSTRLKLDLTPDISLFNDAFRVSTELAYRSDEKKFRQPQTRVVINPRLEWVSLYLYDFVPEFTQYTLSTTKLRGAGADLYLKGFRFFVVYGKSRRATINYGETASFSRRIIGFLVGAGKKENDHLYLTFINGFDNEKSLDQARVYNDTIPRDTITIIPPESTITSTPKSNVVISINGMKGILKRKFNIWGEFATSIFSRDNRTKEIKGLELPSWTKQVLDINISTRYDFSYNLGTELKIGPVGVGFNYYYLGPGYASLGLSSFVPDKKGFESEIRLRLLKGKLALKTRFRSERDNLIEQKLYTTKKEQPFFSISFTPMDFLLSTSVSSTKHKNNSPNETTKVENNALNISTIISRKFELTKELKLTPTASLTYNRQTDENITRQKNAVKNLRFSFTNKLELSKKIHILPTYSFMRTDYFRLRKTNTINTLELSAGYSPIKKAQIKPSISFNLSNDVNSTVAALSFQYKFNKYIMFTLDGKWNDVENKTGSTKFKEWRINSGFSGSF